MSKVLKMTFQSDGGKAVTYNLADPKDGLTKAEVEAAMQSMIDKNAVSVGEETATGIKDVVVRETNDIVLA